MSEEFELKHFFKITFAACSVASSLIYAGKILLDYQYFKKRGLKTPKIKFPFGNYLELSKNKNDSEVVNEWSKKLGKTFGYFEGHTPVLVTSDLDLIREVFIKQFHCFSARKRNALECDDNRPSNHLMRSTKSRWKRMRLIMNPTFSNAKLKEMNPLIEQCIERLINQVNKNKNDEIVFDELLKRFTMDMIWNCAYGMDIDLQNNHDNQYFHSAEQVFKDAIKFKPLNLLSILFHELDPIWIPISNVLNKVLYFFGGTENPKKRIINEFDATLKKRITQNVNRKDFMQLLIDSISDNDEETTKYDNFDLDELNGIIIEKKLTYEEIKSNLKMFMLAGYESTSYALGYCLYVLAIMPEEQQKLVEEIEEMYFKKPNFKPDTSNVNDLKYLNYFCLEILRYFPISRVLRRCVKETTINGIHMTPGLVVRINHIGIHFDSDLWGPEDPNKFYPLRHETKRDELCFLAFGVGPKICLGKKFALLQMKLVLVNILTNFEVCRTENTPQSLEYVEGILRSTKTEIPIMFKRRN